MKILLFFTYGTSLKDWETAGFIEREVEYYKFLSKEFNIDFLFFTYMEILKILKLQKNTLILK